MDVEGTDEMLTRLRQRFSSQEIIAISAANGPGLDVLHQRLEELIAHRPQ
jgi:50S ribosomal subunit-associated GTPase HflX